MKHRTELDAIIAGERKIENNKLLRLDKKPDEIPPLPSGEEALKTSTVAGWETEAIIRAMISNLHNGNDWETLYIYGGSGKVVRDWSSFYEIIDHVRALKENETLFLQSGKPYGKTITTKWAPRCIITNSIIVPNWCKNFQEMVEAGLTVYGQMTAGSFIFIGLQGIIQGTYETIAEAIKVAEESDQYANRSDFEKQLVVTAGLGLMSGAQPLSIKMCGKIGLVAEVNPHQVDRMYNEGRDYGVPYLDLKTSSIDQAIEWAKEYAERKESVSIGIHCNATELLQYLVDNNITPLVLTDQTSAHDLLNGYFPEGLTYEEALKLRESDSKKYLELSGETCVKHVKLMLKIQERGAETFDYGNNIRGEAYAHGLKEAFGFPGFVLQYIRPLFCEGKGPFRWAALSNDPEDIRLTDKYAKILFADDERLVNWLNLAEKYIPFESGLPARVFWAGFFRRAAFGMLMNKLVEEGKLKAPVIIGRDHLDGGSVASPHRETEGMKDGSDAIGDYAVLNLLGNSLSGATWTSYHGGGGVGIGYSLHAGQVIVADGTALSQEKLFRVLTWDPMSALLRHAAAGYDKAIEVAEQYKLVVPGVNDRVDFDYREMYEQIRTFVKDKTGIELFPVMENYSMKLF